MSEEPKQKIFEFEVKDNNNFKLSASWLPFIYSPEDIADLFKSLYLFRIEYFKFWKGIKI